MSRREDIDTAIWSDPDFLALGPDAKLVYFWSFSNPRCGMSGLYKAVREAPLMETGLTSRRLDVALAELSAGRFAFFDGRMLWVRSRIKHLRSKSPNMAKAIARDVEAVSEHPYAGELVEMYCKGPWLATVLEPFRNVSRNPSNPSNPSARVQGKGRDGELSKGSQQHPPSPPSGGRARNREAFREEMTAWSADHFPGADPDQVRSLVAWLEPRIELVTADALRAYAADNEQWAAILGTADVVDLEARAVA